MTPRTRIWRLVTRLRYAVIAAAISWLSMTSMTATAAAQTTSGASATPAAEAGDAAPLLWLEDATRPQTPAWVKARNAESEQRLMGDPRFAEEQARFQAMAGQQHDEDYLNGGFVHRIHMDTAHPLGQWLVMPVTAQARERMGPDARLNHWTLMLDLDALARQNGQRWRFRPGWLNPMCDASLTAHCLLNFTPDGGDRTLLREFDLRSRKLLDNGFRVDTLARTYVHWVHPDQVLIASDFGPGSLSSSGYALQSRLWTRGQPLDQASLRFSAPADSVLYIPHAYRSSNGLLFLAEVWPQSGGAPRYWQIQPNGPATPLTLPTDVVRYHGVTGIVNDRLILMTAAPLQHGTITWPAGSLLAMPLPAATRQHIALVDQLELIHAPAADEAADPIFHLAITRDGLWIGLMKNVSGTLQFAQRTEHGWTMKAVPVPANAAVQLLSGEVAPSRTLVKTESLLIPPRTQVLGGGQSPLTVAQAAGVMDASHYVTEPHFATSRDGTQVPYYLVRSREQKLDGKGAVVMTAYGGFGVSLLPAYLSAEFHTDMAWPVLAHGGVFVMANVRGGGEYGPTWHAQAQRAGHLHSLEDFEAVAQDLVRIGAAAPRRIAGIGASNGGLLMAASGVRRPDLFGAMVADVPLTDMLRFDQLFTGRVWIDEYGDPSIPAERAVLRSYSPLHNLRSGVDYPFFLVTTSSSDDRVHPGHARRFAERLRELQQPVLFHESQDAGHEGAGDLTEQSRIAALKAVFLLQALQLH